MKYLGIKKKIHEIGFDDFYQAGYPNKFHPMNVVAISRVLNKQFWIRVEGGYVPESYVLSHRPLDNVRASSSTVRFKRQRQLIEALDKVQQEIQKKIESEGAPKIP